MSNSNQSRLHENIADPSQSSFDDLPPESFWVPKDSEEDWFDQNATMQRKTSFKLGFSGAGAGAANNTTFSHRSFSTLTHNSSLIIALPKSEGNLRPGKARILFRSMSEPGDKGLVMTRGVEPGSPKVSCTGRVRPQKGGARKTGLWKTLKTALKGRFGVKRPRVVSKASSESAGSTGVESGRWSQS